MYSGPQGQYRNIYPSTKIFISVQKYLSQYKNIFPSTKIFIPVQKYLSQYKNIFPSTKIFFPVQKYLSQYKNIFPVQIENGIYFPRGRCELHWSTCEYGSSFRGLGRRGGLTVSALDSGASAPGSSPGWGHCVVFLGETLNSHSASLYPGVQMGTDKLLGKPNKLLGSHLPWTSTPSTRGRNTPRSFVLRSHLARKAHFFAACFRHCCSFKIVDPAYRYCP